MKVKRFLLVPLSLLLCICVAGTVFVMLGGAKIIRESPFQLSKEQYEQRIESVFNEREIPFSLEENGEQLRYVSESNGKRCTVTVTLVKAGYNTFEISEDATVLYPSEKYKAIDYALLSALTEAVSANRFTAREIKMAVRIPFPFFGTDGRERRDLKTSFFQFKDKSFNENTVIHYSVSRGETDGKHYARTVSLRGLAG